MPIRPSSPLPPSEVQGLAAEIAKCLKLVAPSSMGAEQQTVWLHTAVDALEGIRASEVEAISMELRRSVTRPAQIVPEIARLVSDKRHRANRSSEPTSPCAAEMAINEESNRRRAKAHGNRSEMNEVYEWERQARIDAGLHVPPREPPFGRDELDNLPPHIRQMGLSGGFLEYREGRLCETR